MSASMNMSKVWRRLRQMLRPPRQLKATRFGWFFMLVSVGLGLAAINTENNLMYLALGLMLALIVASGLLSEMSLRQLSVQRRHPPDPVAGKPFLYDVTLTNHKRRLPSFAVNVEEVTRDGQVLGRSFFFRLAAGEEQSRTAEGYWENRGRVRLKGVRVATRFPFGLFEKAVILPDPAELVVLPNSEGAAPVVMSLQYREGFEPTAEAGRGADLFALRPYREGDGARQIHWRKSAGGQGLQSKVYEREERPRVVLALVPGGPVLLEDAVRGAVLWITEMEQAGFEVGLVAGRRIPPSRGGGHRLHLLRELALFEAGEAPALEGDEVLLAYAR